MPWRAALKSATEKDTSWSALPYSSSHMGSIVAADDLEAQKLALERDRIRFERQKLAMEVALKRRERSSSKRSIVRELLSNPMTLAIVGGVITLITGIISTNLTASANRIAEADRAKHARDSAQLTLQADLIKKFVEAPSIAAVRENLTFLADIGLIPSYADYIKTYLAKNPNSAPQLGAPPATGPLSEISDLTFFRSGMYVTADGECSADCSQYPDRTNKTAFVHPDTGKSLDPLTIPYIVLPSGNKSVHLGDLCAVYSLTTGALTYAVVGDFGPRNMKVAEGSVALVLKLGLRPEPKRAPETINGIVYVVFPNSRLTAPVTPERIESAAEPLFKSWGGEEALKVRIANSPNQAKDTSSPR
jgi:hypothetical protein